MSRCIKLTMMTVAFAAIAVSSASATSGPAMITHHTPIGVGSNTAAVSGNASGFPGPAFSLGGGGAVAVHCADGNFNVTTNSITTNTVTVTPTFLGCAVTIAGTPVAAASVDHNCEWTFTLHEAVFTNTTGATTGITVDVPCQTTITAPALGCTLHVTPVTRATGISAQNINAAGANDTSATPWGSKIIGNVANLHYTTSLAAGGSCGVPATGTGSFNGTTAIRNLWNML